MTTIVCDTMAKVKMLLKHASEMPLLKLVVLVGTPSTDDKKACEEEKIEIISFEDILQLGKEAPRDPSVSARISLRINH